MPTDSPAHSSQHDTSISPTATSEPILPPCPDFRGLDRYIDPDIGYPRFDAYSLGERRTALLTWLSGARAPTVLTAAALYALGVAYNLVINEEPLTPGNFFQVLVPKLIRDWWQADSTRVVWGIAVAAATLLLVFVLAERAQRILTLAAKVRELRGDFARWRRDYAIARAQHDRWERTHRDVEELKSAGSPIVDVQGVPFDLGILAPPEHFVGREDDVRHIIELLTAQAADGGQMGSVAAVNGLGGIGKTALATEVVRRLHTVGAFPDGIAAVICKDQRHTVTLLRRVVARFTLGQREPQDDTIAALGLRAQRLLTNKRVLVVLDNIEQDDVARGWRVGDLLGPLRVAGAAVLLTSRAELPTVPKIANVRLDVLPLDDVLSIFTEYYGRGPVAGLTSDEHSDAIAIVEALGRHTLAVKLVAANASTLNRPLATVAQELREHPDQALLLENGEEAVHYALDSSYQALSLDARRLFAAFAAFAAADVGRRAALAVGGALGDRAVAERGLREVVALRLADANPDDSIPIEADRERIRLHSLVRRYAEALFAMWSDDDRVKARQAVAEHYAAYVATASSAVIGPDEANITSALKWAREQGEYRLEAILCWGEAYYWRDRGRYREALAALPSALAAAERLAHETSERENTLRVQNLVGAYGQILRNTGDIEAATAAIQRALAIAQELEDRRIESVYLSDLGVIAFVCGQFDVAEKYFIQALVINREVGNRQQEAFDLSYLGQIALIHGQLELAADRIAQSLSINQDIGYRMGVGRNLCHWGRVALQRGELDMSLDYLTQSLAIAREVGDRQGEGAAILNLGQVALRQHDLDRAEELFRDSLAIAIQVRDAPGIANCYAYLGEFLITRSTKRIEGCDMLVEATRRYSEIGMTGVEELRAKMRTMGCELDQK